MNIELIFPVLNEANSLAKQLAKVREFISKIPEYDFIITVVDNGSTDNTKSIVNKLIQENIVDKYLYLSERGRGRAIKVAINKSNSDIVPLVASLSCINAVVAFPVSPARLLKAVPIKST